MPGTQEPVRLAGSVLSRSCHVCAFFHSKEEEYRVLMPFIKEGFEKGDRAFHVVDPKHRPDHLKRLEQEGIDVADAEAKGQLEVRRWQEAYIKDDHFDQYRMIETIKEALDPAKKQPGKLTRLVANMEWALEDLPGVHDIVEYETRLNHVLPEYHDPVICTYDLSRFDASVVIDIMRTHPMVIIGGILQENPFYVPPDEMLKELKERAADKTARLNRNTATSGSGMDRTWTRQRIALEENRRLRRTMRDLVALSTLPAVWTGLRPGRDRPQPGRRAAQHPVARPDLRPAGGPDRRRGWSRSSAAKHRPDAADIEAVRAALAPLLRPTEPSRPPPSPTRSGPGRCNVAVTRFGIGDDHGVLVTGSRSADFPTEQDRLLLGVGANQTAIVVQRRRAEQQVREQGERLRTTLASIGDAVITTDTEGRSHQPERRGRVADRVDERRRRGPAARRRVPTS